MKAHTKFFHAVATCLMVAVAIAALGLTWGCGAGAPDEGTKAKMYELDAKVKEAHEKKRKPETTARPTRNR
jgi:hypothetical protein